MTIHDQGLAVAHTAILKEIAELDARIEAETKLRGELMQIAERLGRLVPRKVVPQLDFAQQVANGVEQPERFGDRRVKKAPAPRRPIKAGVPATSKCAWCPYTGTVAQLGQHRRKCAARPATGGVVAAGEALGERVPEGVVLESTLVVPDPVVEEFQCREDGCRWSVETSADMAAVQLSHHTTKEHNRAPFPSERVRQLRDLAS